MWLDYLCRCLSWKSSNFWVRQLVHSLRYNKNHGFIFSCLLLQGSHNESLGWYFRGKKKTEMCTWWKAIYASPYAMKNLLNFDVQCWNIYLLGLWDPVMPINYKIQWQPRLLCPDGSLGLDDLWEASLLFLFFYFFYFKGSLCVRNKQLQNFLFFELPCKTNYVLNNLATSELNLFIQNNFV